MDDSLNSTAIKAAKLWFEVIKGQPDNTFISMEEFAAFLGDPIGQHRKGLAKHVIVNIHNPDVISKLEKILGSHGRTYLKILEAQNGDEDQTKHR